jgi:hypothetical protein
MADLDHHDVGVDETRIGEARVDRVQALRDALGAAVILGQPVDHALQRDQPAAAITPAWRMPPPTMRR